jgi:hypothetical protein
MGELSIRLNGKYYPGYGLLVFNAQGGIDKVKMTQLAFANRQFNYDFFEMSGDIVYSATIKLGCSNIDLRSLVSQIQHARHGFNDHLINAYWKMPTT